MNPNILPDLGEAVIRGIRFIEVNLSGADLNGAILRGAFIKANFRGAFLIKADLSETILWEADLSGTRLTQVDFSGADLARANLRGARLDGAIFRGACLQGADLLDTTWLSGEQFGDTNVSGADLPEEIKDFKSIKTVEELSSSSRNLFLTGLLACLVSWLTIASTTDVQLLTNSASLSLPIIGTQIPIVGFFWIAPILLFAFYLYFQFNLQRLWEGLSELPAIFPDGVSLDKKYSTWLFNIRVFIYFSNLKNKKPPLFKLQLLLTSLLTWWSIPFVLYLFWGRYLCRHDITVTMFQISILAFSLLSGFYFYFLSCSTLRGEKEKISTRNKILIISIICAVAIALSLIYYSFLVYRGLPNYFIPRRVLKNIGITTNINISNTDVSTKPQNWAALSKDKDSYSWVKGADLSKRNLRFLIGSKTFLMNANLEKADLMGAYLQGADLRKANISSSANLQNAILNGANLTEANLSFADFSRAFLFRANLQGANFEGSGLQRANLQEADLEKANLQGADLNGIILNGANLEDANLKGAKYLTIDQLSKVKTLYRAKLDPGLEAQIKEKYPWLLEKPKPEEDKKEK